MWIPIKVRFQPHSLSLFLTARKRERRPWLPSLSSTRYSHLRVRSHALFRRNWVTEMGRKAESGRKRKKEKGLSCDGSWVRNMICIPTMQRPIERLLLDSPPSPLISPFSHPGEPGLMHLQLWSWDEGGGGKWRERGGRECCGTSRFILRIHITDSVGWAEKPRDGRH